MSKLPTVVVLSAYATKIRTSARGVPVDDGLEAEWRRKMEHVPYKIVDHKKPAAEILPILQEAEVILADANLLGPFFGKLPKTRWVQGTWAGIDSMMKQVDRKDLPPPFIFTRLGGALNTIMGEYVIGHIIAHERQFVKMQRNQEKKVWEQLTYRTLQQLTVGIIGIGDIGVEIARVCKAFKMTTWGLGRRELASDQICEYVDHYRPTSGLSELLANCDYICNVLPKTAATDDLLSGGALASCAKAPVFINIGRGNVVSEEALLAALDRGWLSHAILDVFRTEPLPPTSPLWTSPKVTVTPHTAACTYVYKMLETFSDNFQRYMNGEPLKYQVKWDAGY